MDVSVIIPVCKAHLPTLQCAVDSAYAAGANEIVICFDGFEFGDIPKIKTHHKPVKRIGFRHNSGVCAARNNAIHNSRYDLILPLDADDELLPDAIEALVNAYEPGTVVYGQWTEMQYGEGEIPDIERVYGVSSPERLNQKSVCHATYLFAKSDWDRVGGYDADFNVGCEDWEMMLNLVVNGGCRLVKVDKPIYRRHVSENGRTAKAYKNREVIRMLLKAKYGEAFNG